MAIYHFSIKTFSRSKGQSATAAIAYRAGAKIECDREGRTHDYTRKDGVLHSEIFLPDFAPSWASDRAQLWNEAERSEKRKNSTVAREFEVALPYELDEEQRIALVRDFSQQIVERHGCAVDANIHDDNRRKRQANHHAHIMLSTRRLEHDGFTDKTRELDVKTSGEVQYWREQWANTVNKHLAENLIMDSKTHRPKTIDHRSLKEQGLYREPTIKMGSKATKLERMGIKTERGDYNRSVSSYDPDKLDESLTTMYKQAEEYYKRVQFLKKRLPEVKRDIEHSNPNLFKMFDDIGIATAPPEKIATGGDLSHSESVEQETLRELTQEEKKGLEQLKMAVRAKFDGTPQLAEKLKLIEDKENELRKTPATLDIPEHERDRQRDQGRGR